MDCAAIQAKLDQLSWCSNSKNMTMCKYGILEVKIQSGEELPSWVDGLVQSGAIIASPGFSKFGHGMCLFHHDSGKLDVKPYWFDAVINDRLGGELQSLPGAVTTQASRALASVDNEAAPLPHAVASWRCFFWQSKPASQEPARPSIGLRKAPPQAKTFLANERTLQNWISPITLILGMSISMLGFSASLGEEGANTVTPLAIGMMMISMVWLTYAFFIFFKRLRKIRARQDDGFDEVFGPSMMVLSLVALCFLALIDALVPQSIITPPAAVAVEEHFGRPCDHILADYVDFPVMDVEPTGVAYHPSRDSIYVASDYHLLEMHKGEITDHPFPGFEMKAVAMDPKTPNLLFLGLQEPNRIVAVNLETMKPHQPLDIEGLMGNHQQLEAVAVCPESLCGLPKSLGTRLIVGGPSNALRVIDVGTYPTVPWSAPQVVDKINLDALLCRRIGRCNNRTVRITDLHITDDALYALADENSELIKVPWSATSKSKLADAPERPSVLQVPVVSKGGWQGFTIKTLAGAEHAIFANGLHGFVKEFRMNGTELMAIAV